MGGATSMGRTTVREGEGSPEVREVREVTRPEVKIDIRPVEDAVVVEAMSDNDVT